MRVCTCVCVSTTKYKCNAILTLRTRICGVFTKALHTFWRIKCTHTNSSAKFYIFLQQEWVFTANSAKLLKTFLFVLFVCVCVWVCVSVYVRLRKGPDSFSAPGAYLNATLLVAHFIQPSISLISICSSLSAVCQLVCPWVRLHLLY